MPNNRAVYTEYNVVLWLPLSAVAQAFQCLALQGSLRGSIRGEQDINQSRKKQRAYY